MHMPSPRNMSLKTAKNHLTIITCVFIMSAAIVVGILIGWELRVRDFSDEGSLDGFDGRMISMVLYLVSVDVIQGGITLGWMVNNDTGCSLFAPDPSSPNCSTVNLFFDQNMLFDANDDGAVMSNERPATPIFAWNPLFYQDERAMNEEFRTSLHLFPSVSGYGSFQDYPFDVHYSRFRLYAEDAVTNATIGVSIGLTGGIAVGFTVNTLLGDGTFPIPPGVLVQQFVISRGVLVKAYAVIIVISVWIITLIFILTSVRSIIFGYAEQVEILVIPVATLFAVTQLRQTMPQAPVGYGAIIDYVGLLPCLAWMFICSATNIGALVFLNPTKKRTTIMDRFLREKLGYRDDLEEGRPLSKSTLHDPSPTRRDEDNRTEEIH